MSRTAPTLASVAADLATVLSRPAPSWVSPATHRAAAALLARLRADALDALASSTQGAVAESMGTTRETVNRWRRGGWIADAEERDP